MGFWGMKSNVFWKWWRWWRHWQYDYGHDDNNGDSLQVCSFVSLVLFELVYKTRWLCTKTCISAHKTTFQKLNFQIYFLCLNELLLEHDRSLSTIKFAVQGDDGWLQEFVHARLCL